MSSIFITPLSKFTARVLHSFRVPESSPASELLRTVTSALLVGLSYYIGTRIGFAWTPSGQPNSTFWPPNAILLASFLLAPRKIWWTLIVAVFPAHMIAQLQIGVPLWTAVGWFITNTSEALIGAFFITRLSGPRNVLDSVRGVFMFVLFGVFLAPFATSFLDAFAVVITGWGRSYWPIGVERFWTNALAQLTIVPAIVFCGSKGISWIRKVTLARSSEAILLALGTVLAAVLVFGLHRVSPARTPALLYVPLPLLLWAAARFDLAGLSLSLLSVALISIRYALHGQMPFPYASLEQNIVSLQILFCTVVVPLMFLSAVMGEARRTQESLRKTSSCLIEAQEQERHRIARELHDNLGQELALVTVTLDRLIESLGDAVDPGLLDLSEEVKAISHTTREISHGLYPSQLEYLGLAPAVKRLCNDMRSERLSISLAMGNVPPQLQPSISLCLYRVAQETLHNILTHSQAHNVQVELDTNGRRIRLTITDDGLGFDLNHAEAGLGLISMRQRVVSVGGTIDITSSPNAGTEIEVRIPLRIDHIPSVA